MNFFESHTLLGGGYGLLYNWLVTQPQARVEYGYMYNWFAVADSRNICSVGWHIPTEAEWNTLMTYLGGGTLTGIKLKEAGISHWYNPNNGTNEVGFNARGAGYRANGDGAYASMLGLSMMWSS